MSSRSQAPAPHFQAAKNRPGRIRAAPHVHNSARAGHEAPRAALRVASTGAGTRARPGAPASTSLHFPPPPSQPQFPPRGARGGWEEIEPASSQMWARSARSAGLEGTRRVAPSCPPSLPFASLRARPLRSPPPKCRPPGAAWNGGPWPARDPRSPCRGCAARSREAAGGRAGRARRGLARPGSAQAALGRGCPLLIINSGLGSLPAFSRVRAAPPLLREGPGLKARLLSADPTRVAPAWPGPTLGLRDAR